MAALWGLCAGCGSSVTVRPVVTVVRAVATGKRAWPEPSGGGWPRTFEMHRPSPAVELDVRDEHQASSPVWEFNLHGPAATEVPGETLRCVARGEGSHARPRSEVLAGAGVFLKQDDGELHTVDDGWAAVLEALAHRSIIPTVSNGTCPSWRDTGDPLSNRAGRERAGGGVASRPPLLAVPGARVEAQGPVPEGFLQPLGAADVVHVGVVCRIDGLVGVRVIADQLPVRLDVA
jgi:hypothetical protein